MFQADIYKNNFKFKQKPIFLKNICKQVNSFVKVNIAGEHAAVLIYKEQLKLLQNNFLINELELQNILHCLHTEERHFNYFQDLIQKNNNCIKLQPSILINFWQVLLKFFIHGSMHMSQNIFNNPTVAVNITSEAVENIIIKHYQEQILYLKSIKDILMHLQDLIINERSNSNAIQEKASQTDAESDASQTDAEPDTSQTSAKSGANIFIFLDDLLNNIESFLQDEMQHHKDATNWLEDNKLKNIFTNVSKNANLASIENFKAIMQNFSKLKVEKTLSNIISFGCKIAIKTSYKI